ncbi:MAG: YncE family protein [Bacteroidota bacterium]
MMNTRILVLITGVLFFSSCRKEEPEAPAADSAGLGAYVSNEGSFMNSNASITYITPGGSSLQDPFLDRNGFPIGDVLQSLAFSGEKGFAVVNNSQRIIAFNRFTFAFEGEVDGLSYPRYMLPLDNGKAYVSNGSMDGELVILNLSDLSVAGSIPVGKGPERMAKSDDLVAVTNSGGWLSDQTVTLIHAPTDQVTATITVGDRPIDLVVDASGDFWVLCSGKALYDDSWNIIGHTDASLWRLSGADGHVEWTTQLGVNGDHPDDLAISPDGEMIYFNLAGIHALSAIQPESGYTVIIPGNFHSLDVHPANGEIWLTSVPDFVSSSEVLRYRPSGALITTYQSGIGSNGVWWP